MTNRVGAGKRAKRKGSNFERAVAKKFQEWWGSKFQRTPMSGGSQLKDDWRLAGDVVTIADDFPFCVEAKNQDGWGIHLLFTSNDSRPWKWWEQAKRECPDDLFPLLIFTAAWYPEWIMIHVSTLDRQEKWEAQDQIFLLDPDGESVVVFLSSEFFSSDDSLWRNIHKE